MDFGRRTGSDGESEGSTRGMPCGRTRGEQCVISSNLIFQIPTLALNSRRSSCKFVDFFLFFFFCYFWTKPERIGNWNTFDSQEESGVSQKSRGEAWQKSHSDFQLQLFATRNGRKGKGRSRGEGNDGVDAQVLQLKMGSTRLQELDSPFESSLYGTLLVCLFVSERRNPNRDPASIECLPECFPARQSGFERTKRPGP